MQVKDFLRAWSWLVTFQLGLVIAPLLVSVAGGGPNKLFGFITVDAQSIPAIGLPLDLAIGLVTLAATLWFASARAAAPWYERIPMLHLSASAFDRNPGARAVGKNAIFCIAHVFPAVAIGQMAHRYFVGKAFDHHGAPGSLAVHGPGWKFFVWPDPVPEDMRFGHAEGVSHFAVLPYVYLVVLLGYVAMFAVTAWTVYRPARRHFRQVALPTAGPAPAPPQGKAARRARRKRR